MIFYSKKNVHRLSKFLNKKINLIDIGSQGGLFGWLKDIEKIINKIEFDFYSSSKDSELLFDKESYQDFYECENSKQSSIFKPNKKFAKYEMQYSRLNFTQRKKIKTFRLDQKLIDKNEQIDVIKIDTQGSEYQILKGSIQTIKKNKPLIFIETWSLPVYENINTFEEIVKFLKENDYEIWGIDEASSLRLDISKDFPKNNSRRRLAGLNIFFSPNLDNLDQTITKSKLESYSFIFFIHGYLDWSWKLVENIENSKYKSELKKAIKEEFSFPKLKYLKYLLLDVIKRFFKKKSKNRYTRFT